jgi:uncharacterized membrane protein YcaP (DUF421 family)
MLGPGGGILDTILAYMLGSILGGTLRVNVGGIPLVVSWVISWLIYWVISWVEFWASRVVS